MATDTPPNPDPDRAPTLDDVGAMTAAAQQAMAGITNAEQAIAAAIDGMKAEAANRNLTVPDEVVNQIATAASAATISEMRKIGAIRDDTDPPPADPPNPSAGAPPANPPVGDPPPERKKTPAERFLGL